MLFRLKKNYFVYLNGLHLQLYSYKKGKNVANTIHIDRFANL